jgi:tetratricopeptide (TPR) repeat protein
VADTRIDELRRRLERDPGSRLFAQLAEELRKNGELVEAVRVARAGLAVHTAYPSARLTLGRALLDSGDPSGARAELESALRDAPDNILASRYLAQARESLGDLKGAVDQYRKTLLMAPGDRQLQVALAAVEARMAAPEGAASAGAETTLPMPRQTPPPLPPTAQPARPMAPPASEPSPAGAALHPTLRMRAPETVVPPPPSSLAAAAEAVAEGPSTLPSTTAAGPAGDVAAGEAGAPFSSPTLAELYYQQGLVERAVDVYRQVVQREPANDKARTRLSKLEEAAAPQERAARRLALERTIAGLETLLEAVRRS